MILPMNKYCLFVFDLDDTLYSEYEFVKSGFMSVAKHISKNYNLSKKVIFHELIEIFHKHGRGKVFNIFFENNNIKYPGNYIYELVDIYRYHQNYDIQLYDGAEALIKYLIKKNKKIAILTDTNWLVQKKKVKTLNLNSLVDKVYYSNKHKTKKPDIKLYNMILDYFKVEFHKTVWIGDDPNSDFEVPKKMGGITIRIKNGRLKDVNVKRYKDAEFCVPSIKNFYESIID